VTCMVVPYWRCSRRPASTKHASKHCHALTHRHKCTVVLIAANRPTHRCQPTESNGPSTNAPINTYNKPRAGCASVLLQFYIRVIPYTFIHCQRKFSQHESNKGISYDFINEGSFSSTGILSVIFALQRGHSLIPGIAAHVVHTALCSHGLNRTFLGASIHTTHSLFSC
jgi:hypothetical protein